MLDLRFPFKVKLICGILYRDRDIHDAVLRKLEKKLGTIDFESDPIPFTYTDYYTPEMGKGLIRRFVSFKKLIDPSAVVAVKLLCVKFERAYAPGKKRLINLDPGYVERAKLVLATTKDYSHRIYLGKGIFAEVTLSYRDNDWQELPSTFPDYRTAEYKAVFQRIRGLYCEQLKEGESSR